MQAARLRPRSITSFAALAGLALWLGVSSAAAQGTPEQRAACEADAMRLCQEFVPDVQRITACMSQKRRYLSPRCRVYFGGKRRR
jgi:type II secretory pathway component PulL